VYARRQFCADLEVYRPPEETTKYCICRQNGTEGGQNTEKQHKKQILLLILTWVIDIKWTQKDKVSNPIRTP